MSRNCLPPDDKDHADLIAYLDGELEGEVVRAVEARISRDPAVRAEADSLKPASGTCSTICRGRIPRRTSPTALSTSCPLTTPAPPYLRHSVRALALWRRLGRRRGFFVGLVGYLAAVAVVAPSAEKNLVRDLRLIDNLSFYEDVETLEFLRELDRLRPVRRRRGGFVIERFKRYRLAMCNFLSLLLLMRRWPPPRPLPCPSRPRQTGRRPLTPTGVCWRSGVPTPATTPGSTRPGGLPGAAAGTAPATAPTRPGTAPAGRGHPTAPSGRAGTLPRLAGPTAGRGAQPHQEHCRRARTPAS